MTTQPTKQPTIHDLVDWFLLKKPMTHRKLQALLYYSEAWSNALYDTSIIPDIKFVRQRDWAVNPEIKALYEKHDYHLIPKHVTAIDTSIFTDEQIDVLESVWHTYGDMKNDLQSIIVHEFPWEYTPDDEVISTDDMRKFYRLTQGRAKEQRPF